VVRKAALTAPEKILLHLDEFAGAADAEGDAPYALSQNGIADRLGLLRSHVPRNVRKLVDRGLAGERLSHLKSGGRSRRIYRPTWEGALEAREIRRRLESRPVKVELPDGARTARMGEVPGLLGVRCGLLDIVLASERGPVGAESLRPGGRQEGFVDDWERAPAPRPFFGRRSELETMLGWLQGEPRVVTVLGVSGIGKTSFARGALEELKGRRHRLWLALHEWDTLPGLLRPLAAFLERTGRRRLGRLLAEEPSPELPAVHELLRSEFSDLGAVIVVDDLQKAPAEVLDGVRAMADAALQVNGPRLLVLSREKRRLCNPDARSRGLVRELQLGGLDGESALRLIGNSVPAGERAGLMAAAGGHPLYIELLASRGAAAGREAIEEHLRDEVYSGLPQNERRILGTAAVLGREAPAEALLDPGGDPAVLDGLVEKNLLVRSASGVLSMHDTLREFFLSRLSPGEKREHHLKAAAHLLGAGPGPTLDALRHLVLGGDLPGAAAAADEHGRRLLDSGQGRTLVAEVLDRLGPGDCDPGRRGRLLLLSAEARAASGERDRALQLYREAAAHGGETAARSWYGAGEIMRERSDWEGAADAYSRAAALSPALAAESLRGQACLDWRRGDWKASSARFSEALKLARREGRGPLAASLLIDMANLESDRGDAESALSLYSQALKALESGDSLREEARVHNNIGAVLFYEDRVDEALEHYQKSLDLSERCGEVSTSAYALSNIGQILARKGEEDRALKYIDASMATFERLGDDYMRSSGLLAKGILYRTVRDWERSEKFFQDGLALLGKLGMPRELAEARFEHALALRKKGDRAGAAAELELSRVEFERLGAAKELERTERELKGLRAKRG
jgi:tetratricopeptide (TPR) repeat protein/DNA-binding MarR family transcriptional regulator